jgi:hypothetical protein
VGATEPGASLAAGDTASVKWSALSAGNTFDVDVTVDRIEEAPRKDFADVSLDEDQKKATPYYVNVTIENTGETMPRSTNGEPGLGVGATDDKGQDLENVIFIGDFPPCEYVDPKLPLRKGKKYESCLVFLVPEGGTLGEVQWTGSAAYVTKPVVWK